jgi:drug/metabolite transporter (DMT)-like permease
MQQTILSDSARPSSRGAGRREPAASGPRARSAILCVLGAAATFALAAAAVKALRGEVPVMQVILFRNLLAIPVLLALAVWRPAGRGAMPPWPRC